MAVIPFDKNRRPRRTTLRQADKRIPWKIPWKKYAQRSAVGAACVGAVAWVAYLGARSIDVSPDGPAYESAYRRALAQYGDRNGDRRISFEEEHAFWEGLLRRHDAIRMHGEVYREDGTLVDKRELTQWLRQYRP